MTTTSTPVQPTVPVPDIQQPIARFDNQSKKWMCDPVWYRFFRSPQFTAASIGGQVGIGSGGTPPSPAPSPIVTMGQLSSQAPIALSFDTEDGADGFPIPGPQGLQGPVGIGIPGNDGEPGEDGTVGPPGVAGPSGPAGATGPPGPQALGLDGDDGSDPMMIPGAQGPQGNPGAQGPMGQPAIIFIEGDQGDDGQVGPPGAAGATGTATGSYLSFDSHPSSPNAANDEFEGASLSAQWTVQQNTASVVNFSSYCPGSIWVKLPSGSTGDYVISEAFAPGSADFSVTLKCYGSLAADFNQIGVQVSDTAASLNTSPGSGTGYNFILIHASTPLVQINMWASGSHTGGSGENPQFSTGGGAHNTNGAMYLHLQRVGGTWTAWFSSDGAVFSQYNGISFTAAPTVAFITLFLQLSGSSASVPIYGAFDFLRVNQLFM